MKSRNKIKYITNAAIIAALYVVLTYAASALGLASGPIQCRLSEALCVLPAFTPAAVPGLFVGCLLSNMLTGCIALDVIFGSVATLLGAAGTYFLSKFGANRFTFSLPTILSNTLIVPFVIKYAYGGEGAIWYFVLTVGAGEIISCGILGTVLYLCLKKSARHIFN